jgi:O-antigen ligase
LSSLVILVPLALSGQAVNLLEPAYRLDIGADSRSLAVRPAALALLLIGATLVLRLRRPQASDLLFVTILALAVFVLKTRAPVFYGVISVGLIYTLYRTSVHERVVQLGLALVLVVGVMISYFSGVIASLLPYLTRGNAELTLNLTGRIPLWEVLVQDVQERPRTGVGFGAYWNTENLIQVRSQVGFPAVDAHNGFLAELLSTGAIGLALLLFFLLYGLSTALKKTRRGERFAWVAVTLLVYYLMLNLTTSMMQTYLEIPLIAVFAALGVLSIRNPARERKSEGLRRP